MALMAVDWPTQEKPATRWSEPATTAKPVDVAPPPVFQVPSGSGRRGRPPKVTEADVAEATIDPIPPNEVVL